MDQSTAAELFKKYYRGECNPEERRRLFEALGLTENEAIFKPLIEHEFINSPVELEMNAGEATETLTSILNIEKSTASRSMHRVHFLRTAWFRWAAIFIVIGGIAVYRLINTPSALHQPIVQNSDIQPGSQKAMLTLSDGRKIELGSAASEIINDGSLSIKNNSGQLIYSGSGFNESGSQPIPSSGGVARGGTNINVNPSNPRAGVGFTGYNTMSTPRGGQYQLTLSDGTKVWLNAASSITYPVLFTSTNREVNITGEVYFEVAKKPGKPFIVIYNNNKVEVLGTSFNINTYPDENSKASLIEGVIKVNGKILSPGQAFQSGKIFTTNIRQDVAWKDGVFNFQGLNLHQAMRQIARWYDIDVRFNGDFSDVEIRGKIGRNLSLLDVLKGMEDKDIHFAINGRMITVHK